MPRAFLMQFKKKKKVQVVYQENGPEVPSGPVDTSDSSEDEGLEISTGSMTGSESPDKMPTFRESENSAFSRIRPKADMTDSIPSALPASFHGFPPPPEGPLDLRPKPSLPHMYDMYGRELDPYMGMSRYEGGAGYPLAYTRPSFMGYTDLRLPITNYYITMARLQMEHNLRQQAGSHAAPSFEEEAGEKRRAGGEGGGGGGESPASSRGDSGRDSPEDVMDDDEEEEVDVEEQSEPETETCVSPKPEQSTTGSHPEVIRPPEQPHPPPFLHLPPFPPSAHHHPHHPHHMPPDAPHALPRVPGLDFPAFLGSPFGSPPGLVHPAFFPPGGPLVPTPGPGRQRDPSKPPPLKKYKCDVCAKAFSRSNTLVTHKRIHTGEKPFKCELCGRAFRQPGNLTRHRLTHTTVKPYVCPRCNKAFNRASNLHTHMRTHSNYKPFVCPFCGKGFHQKIDMKIHSYTHTGEKPPRFSISR